MSFIPSFILSTLLFCNVTMPGGWDGAVFTEGIICEIPHARFSVSVDEPGPALRNAAVIFQSDPLNLKIAAGSLAVSGTGGTGTLSATLPARTDGKKTLSFFMSWNCFSFYATEKRGLFQLDLPFISLLQANGFKADLKSRLSAGLTVLQPSGDSGWYLRYPLHAGCNVHFFRDTLILRLLLSDTTLEAEGSAALAFSDALPTARESSLNLLFKTPHTEASFSCTAAPSWYVLPSGSFTDETFQAKASFTLKDHSSDGISSTFKANAGFVQKQPAAAFEKPEQVISAGLSGSSRNGPYGAGISFSADRLCPENKYEEAEFTHAVDVTLPSTELTAKVTFVPFKEVASKEEAAPSWSIKADRTFNSGSASYTASFRGNAMEKQEFSLSEGRGNTALYTTVTVKKDILSWSFSFTHSW